MCSVAGRSGAGILVFFTSGFHRFVCDEACQFRNQQSRTLVIVATIVLSGTRGPWLFLVIREGLGSGVRLGARSTQRLTYQLRLALEPECPREPHGHRQRRSPAWSGLGPRHSSCLWFQMLSVEARSS